MSFLCESDRCRFEKQLAMPEIGEVGQERLMAAKVVIIGCGALGSAQADLLVRAGIGQLTLVDPDVVSVTNLHRQILFDEKDASEGRLKVEAAAHRLKAANSRTKIQGIPTLATMDNLPEIIGGAAVVLDGTDLIASRQKIDQACRRAGLPWIYGGVMGTRGTVATIPTGSPCLACLFGGFTHDPGERDVWKRFGHLGANIVTTAAIQVIQAMKFIVQGTMERELMTFDLWNPSVFRMALSGESMPGCDCL